MESNTEAMVNDEHSSRRDGGKDGQPSPDEKETVATGNPEDRETFHGRSSDGDSAGGNYPDPRGDEEGEAGGFMGHGGQSDMAYYGHGQLGDKKLGPNPNAPDKKE
jgi:hypothetical protein